METLIEYLQQAHGIAITEEEAYKLLNVVKDIIVK